MALTIRGTKLEKYEGSDHHVTVPEGIVSIADYAFYGASEMQYVSLPSTLQEIGSNAFYDCEQLQEIRIPDSVFYTGNGLFARCRNLKKAVLSQKITVLNGILFYQCENLEEIVFPQKLTKIGRGCFQQAHSLRRIVLPDSVKTVEDNAFDDCVSLEEIHLPSALRTLGNNVFFGCVNLKKLELPGSLEEIGTGALETRGILSLQVPENLKIHPKMLDNNWNMFWNFGSNGRYNGKNEDVCRLVRSYIPDTDLKWWKPEFRTVLCINYLETGQSGNAMYETWIKENKEILLDTILAKKRWEALYEALKQELLPQSMIRPVLEKILDPAMKAKIMNLKGNTDTGISDLFDLL